MKFESDWCISGKITITAEGSDERAVLNVAVASLELIYPNAEDLQRPTPVLLLLEALKIIGSRMELKRTLPGDHPLRGTPPRNTAPSEPESQPESAQ